MTTEKAIMSKIMASYPTSLHGFFTDPQFIASIDKFGCVQTSILRYYLTAFTGKRLKDGRLNSETIKKQIQKLKRIDVDSNFDLDAHLELIKKGGEMYGKSKTQMKSHVSYGKRFFDFVKQSVIPRQKKQEYNKNVMLSYTEAIMDKSEWVSEKRYANKQIILKNDPNLYLKELKNKHPKLNDEKIYNQAQSKLNAIFDTIESFAQDSNTRKVTSTKHKNNILRFIGWYKKQYKLSIDELSIEKIFPIINPYIEYKKSDIYQENFITKIATEEWCRKQEIKEESQKFITIFKKYLGKYLGIASKETKKVNIQSLINFCCFLYEDITNKEENDRFQDISLINRLYVLMRDVDKIKETKQEKIIPFNWEEIEAVCERLRIEANQDYQYTSSKRAKNNKGTKLKKRVKAIHIQKFLAIAFFCVMPPDRQRTFRELTFGETLKYGIRDAKRGTFTSYDKLKKGEKPKYYIHLLPHQYKTGDTYGTYWHEINNVKYADGKRFYDYLNQWLFKGYRNELATTGKTNCIFIKSEKGISYKDDGDKSQNATKFGQFIADIFNVKTKFPLNPHALRDIYVTHINNLGVSEEIRKAIAYMMHHDLDTADKTYNRQTPDEKTKLGVEFVNQYHLGNSAL